MYIVYSDFSDYCATYSCGWVVICELEIWAAAVSEAAPQADCLPPPPSPCGHRMVPAPYSLPPQPPSGVVYVHVHVLVYIHYTHSVLHLYMHNVHV